MGWSHQLVYDWMCSFFRTFERMPNTWIISWWVFLFCLFCYSFPGYLSYKRDDEIAAAWLKKHGFNMHNAIRTQIGRILLAGFPSKTEPLTQRHPKFWLFHDCNLSAVIIIWAYVGPHIWILFHVPTIVAVANWRQKNCWPFLERLWRSWAMEWRKIRGSKHRQERVSEILRFGNSGWMDLLFWKGTIGISLVMSMYFTGILPGWSLTQNWWCDMMWQTTFSVREETLEGGAPTIYWTIFKTMWHFRLVDIHLQYYLHIQHRNCQGMAGDPHNIPTTPNLCRRCLDV